jgi:hypothetical protein
MSDSLKTIRVFCLAALVLCGMEKLRASDSESTAVRAVSDFLSFLTQPSVKIEPWLAAGITNHDRSPEFLQHLQDATAQRNVLAEGYLGMLQVTGDGMPTNLNDGMRLLFIPPMTVVLPR